MYLGVTTEHGFNEAFSVFFEFSVIFCSTWGKTLHNDHNYGEKCNVDVNWVINWAANNFEGKKYIR